MRSNQIDTIKQLFILLLLALSSLPLMGQTDELNIEICGKTYHITGDNLTIVIGKNLQLNISREVPPKVRAEIARRYESELAKWQKAYEGGRISLEEHTAALKQAKINLQTAQATAEKLAAEFSQVNFAEESYLYRLAFVVYQQGDLDGAAAVLSQNKLQMNEDCQAAQYLLRVAAYWQRGRYEPAFQLLESVIRKYPSFPTLASYADYLHMNSRYEEAAEQYLAATPYAGAAEDSAFLNQQANYCYLVSGNITHIQEQPLDAIANQSTASSQRNTCNFPPPLMSGTHPLAIAKRQLWLACHSEAAACLQLLKPLTASFRADSLMPATERLLFWLKIGQAQVSLQGPESYPPLYIDELLLALAEKTPAYWAHKAESWLCPLLLDSQRYTQTADLLARILARRQQAYEQAPDAPHKLEAYFESLCWQHHYLYAKGKGKPFRQCKQQIKQLLKQHPEQTGLQAKWKQLKSEIKRN